MLTPPILVQLLTSPGLPLLAGKKRLEISSGAIDLAAYYGAKAAWLDTETLVQIGWMIDT